ncbi:MAG: glycosyltransferase family 39 protein [Planctomycetaceae bacterium]
MRFLRFTTTIAAVLLFAFLLRAGVLWFRSESLADDRDAYIAVAEGIVQGAGFANSQTGEPTAYRPPLYPLALAAVFQFCSRELAIALLHLVVGTATVWLTFRIGRLLGLSNGATVAALIVAIDPLLLQYTAFPMTETVFTFLLTALLVVTTHRSDGARLDRARRSQPVGFEANVRMSWRRALAIGVIFGLCALCRPTVWAVGLLAALVWLQRLVFQKDGTVARRNWRATALMLLGVAIVVSPWLVRNLIVLGKPIFTTTHGGYTLILGNNPVFYQEVVEKPLGTVWEDASPERSQQAWYKQLKRDMAAELGNDAGEAEQDRWMYRRAFKHIADDPSLFVRASLLRFLRFWNVVPLGNARAGVPATVLWGVGAFYAVVLAGFVLGLCNLKRIEWVRWMPLLLAIAGFCLVHLLYWTDTRMRAPVIPAIALIFGLGIERLQQWLRRPPDAL